MKEIGYTFTFKGKKLFISRKDIEKCLKTMKPSSIKRPGFFLKENEQFFRIKHVLKEIQKRKKLKPSALSDTMKNSIDKFLNMGINVYEEVNLNEGKDIHLWKKYVKTVGDFFSYGIEKSVKSGPYTFDYVGKIMVRDEFLSSLTMESSKIIPEKRGIYLVFSSNDYPSSPPFFYYVNETRNLREELEKIIEMSEFLVPTGEDVVGEDGEVEPQKYLERLDAKFKSKFKKEDILSMITSAAMVNEVVGEFEPISESFEVYFLETDDEKQLNEIYSHMASFEPVWNMILVSPRKGEKKMDEKKIYQLRVEFEGLRPKIWRSILVENTISFEALHLVIQSIMDWTNEHMHAFYAGKYKIKGESILILSFLKKEKDQIEYIYDFGDDWHIKIKLEKIFPLDKSKKAPLPLCLDGMMAAPPEDCGGVWGYMQDLEVLKNPRDEEYEELREWYGEDFDPKKFDKEEANKRIKEFMKSWLEK